MNNLQNNNSWMFFSILDDNSDGKQKLKHVCQATGKSTHKMTLGRRSSSFFWESMARIHFFRG